MTCAYATPPPKCHFGGGVAIFLNILKYTYRMTMIRCALERLDLMQSFKYPGCHHITHRKFSRGTWSWRISQKLMKLRNFVKSKILHSSLITRCSFTSMQRETMIWCAPESLALRQPFQYLQRYYITHRKLPRATWSQKSFWKMDETQKFRESRLALKSKILHSSLITKCSFTSM